MRNDAFATRWNKISVLYILFYFISSNANYFFNGFS